MDEKLIKKLLSQMKCGVCGRNYEPNNVRILGHRGDLWFISAFCPVCSSQAMVAAMIKEEIKGHTELSKEEQVKFSTLTSIEGDEVLEIHNFLKDFDGDFSKLFHQDTPE